MINITVHANTDNVFKGVVSSPQTLKNNINMSKVKIVSIIYAIGIIIGALFFDVWGADTTPFKTLSVFAWTVIFIIALFFVDKNEKK